MVMGNLIDGSVIQPIEPFEINEDERHDTFVYENNALKRAVSYWGDEDWDIYCERYGIENTIDFSIGIDSVDQISCDFFKITHKDFKFYADLTVNGKINSVFIKDLPDLFDFMHYVGSTIKLLAQSKYRNDKIEGVSDEHALKVEGWGIGDDDE